VQEPEFGSRATLRRTSTTAAIQTTVTATDQPTSAPQELPAEHALASARSDAMLDATRKIAPFAHSQRMH
jgi:hypothetical protein